MASSLPGTTPSVLTIVRERPGQYGWAILGPAGCPIHVALVPARGLTRWEARQTLGLLGLPYEEKP